MPTTTRQLASIAGISESSVRNYTRAYAELLSPQARGESGDRQFSDADVSTLCTIANLRKEDVPRAEILERLRRGDIVIDATLSPHQATPSHVDRPQATLATIAVESIIVGRIEALERNQATLLRAAVLWGALWGAVVALAFAAFVLWVLWLVAAN